MVRGIGLDLPEPRPARVVELMNQCRIAAIGLRRGDIFDPVAFPQAVGAAEGGEPAIGADSGAGQDDDVAELHGLSIFETDRREKWPAVGRATARFRTRSTIR